MPYTSDPAGGVYWLSADTGVPVVVGVAAPVAVITAISQLAADPASVQSNVADVFVTFIADNPYGLGQARTATLILSTAPGGLAPCAPSFLHSKTNLLA